MKPWLKNVLTYGGLTSGGFAFAFQVGSWYNETNTRNQKIDQLAIDVQLIKIDVSNKMDRLVDSVSLFSKDFKQYKKENREQHIILANYMLKNAKENESLKNWIQLMKIYSVNDSTQKKTTHVSKRFAGM